MNRATRRSPSRRNWVARLLASLAISYPRH